MKYLCLISIWTVALGTAFYSASARIIQADPTDDFSFSLSHAPETEVYSLMSEKRVADILADRLDLFPQSQVPKLAHHLVSLCKQYRFDPAFVLSLIEVESGFKIRAISPVGALGLMQVMPATARYVVRELGFRYTTPYLKASDVRLTGAQAGAMSERVIQDPFVNMAIGIAYLAWLRDHYQGLSPYYLVAAYNIGPARLDELRARKSFRPTNTKQYYEAIRKRVPDFRFYTRTKVQGGTHPRRKLGV